MTRTLHHPMRLALVVALAVAGLAACSDDDDGDGDSAGTTTTSAAPADDGAADEGAPAAGCGPGSSRWSPPLSWSPAPSR